MRPILLTVGSLNFYSYGFLTALGIIVGGFVVDYLARRKRLLTKQHPEYLLIDGLLLSVVTGIVTARLGYILLYNFIFRTEILGLHNWLGGGFVFYAGLLGGLGAFIWWLKRQHEALLPWLDLVMISIAVGAGLNQIGGLLNDGLYVHLASCVGYFALAGLSYAILVTEKKPGHTFRSGLFLLILLNFFIGFWWPETIMWFGLTLTQWASVFGLVGCGVYSVKSNKK